jgi:hypothetical protein
MTKLPEFSLSVRQPWAWSIIHAGKDFENRSWKDTNPGLKFSGRVALHAAKGMTRDEYESACNFMHDLGVSCPDPIDLQRGGIIGTVEVVRAIIASSSPWFFGPIGLKLRNPEPCDFIPATGQLGFFKWTPADPSVVPAPARWMLPENGGKR